MLVTETSFIILRQNFYRVSVLHRNISERSSCEVVSVLQGSARQWQVNSGEKGEKLETSHDNFELLENVVSLMGGC